MSAQVREGSVCKRVVVALAVAGSGVILYHGYKKWTSSRQTDTGTIEAGDPSSKDDGNGDSEELPALLDIRETTDDAITKSDRPSVTIQSPSTNSSTDHSATGGSDVSLSDSFERVYLSQLDFTVTPPIVEENGGKSPASANFESVSRSQLESQITQQLQGNTDETVEAKELTESESMCGSSLESSAFVLTESETGCDMSKEGSGCEATESGSRCNSKEGSGCEITVSGPGCDAKDGSGYEVTESGTGCESKDGSGCQVTETKSECDLKEDSGCEIAETESEMSKASSSSDLTNATSNVTTNQCVPPIDESAMRIRNGDPAPMTIETFDAPRSQIIASSAIAVGHPDDSDIRVELGMDITTQALCFGLRHVIENVQEGSVASQLGLSHGAELLKLNGMTVARWSHQELVDHFTEINIESMETTYTTPHTPTSGDSSCVEVTVGLYVEDDLVRGKVTDSARRDYDGADDTPFVWVTGPGTHDRCWIEGVAGCMRCIDRKLSMCAKNEADEACDFRQVCFGGERPTCLFVADNADGSFSALTVLDRQTVTVKITWQSLSILTSLQRSDPRFFYVHVAGDDRLFESTAMPGKYLAVQDGRVMLITSSDEEAIMDSRLRFRLS